MGDSASVLACLEQAGLVVLGQLRTASNATLLCEAEGMRCVYKPVAGERPLWDFPEATLGRREVLAYRVSSALGWDLVPPTVWRQDGPYGAGMCQAWVDAGDRRPVDVVPADSVRGLTVIEGEGQDGSPVALIHEDAEDLRRMAVFDVLVNNADRKGGHVIADATGRVWGIDHGVCFAAEPKLRTVLWGWAGQSLRDADVAALSAFAPVLTGLLGEEAAWLDESEAVAALVRLDALTKSRTYPEPGSEWPFLPWPVM